MAKNVELDLRVNGTQEVKKAASDFEGLTRQIKRLRLEIQEAEATGDKSNLLPGLRKQLDDTRDSLDRINFKNKEFSDKLASLPGPLGKAGGAISGIKSQVETFGVGLTALVGTVGLIVGAFALLKGAIGASKEQQEKWNKIIIFGERILNGLFAALEPVLDVLFELIAPLTENAAVTNVLTKAFAGLAAIMVASIKLTVNLIGSFGDLYEAIKTIAGGFGLIGQSVGAFFRGEFSKSADLAEQALTTFAGAGSTLLDSIKARGKDIITSTINTFNAAEEKVGEGLKRQTKTEKDLADQRKKDNADAAKLTEEQRKKKEDAIKSELAGAEALLDKEKQIKLQAAITAQEKLDIEKDFQDKKFKLQLEALDKQMALYSIDSAEYQALQTQKTAIEAQQIAANIKYKEDTAKNTADQTAAEAETNRKKASDEKELLLSGIRDRQAALVAEREEATTGRALTFQEELDFFNKKRELDKEGLVANKASKAELLAFDAETAKARVEIEKAQQEAKLAIISDALGTIADAVGRDSAAGKALSVAQAVINTYLGATKALGTYPPPFGAIAAGTVILAGLLNVKKILSTKLPAPPGAKSAPPDTSSSIAGSITAPATQGVQNLIPTIGSSQASVGSAIANTLNSTFAANQQRPLQAFVVSSEVTSAQQLQRRRNTSAQLGG